MLSSEVQRIILLVGLGVFGWLLVYTWTQDFGPGVQDAPPRQEAPLGERGETAPIAEFPESERRDGVADVPGEGISSPAGDDDVPVDLARPQETEPAPTALEGSDRLVHVRTPVHEVWIDRHGGDVVRLKLPRFPVEVGGKETWTLLDRRHDHVYIAQSGLIGADGTDRNGRPLYTTRADEYVLEEGELELELRHESGGVALTKRYTFRADDYLIDVDQDVDNRSAGTFKAQVFVQLKRDASRPEDSGVPFGPRPYVGAAFTTPEDRYYKIDFEDLDDGTYRVEVDGGWAAVLQHYFVSAWVGTPGEVNAYYGRRLGDGNYAVGFVGPQFEVPSNQRASVGAGLYAGPKDQRRLEEIAPHLNLTVDYGFLWWMSVPLFHVLDAIHSVVGNWGVAIILLTFCVKLLLYPLASASYRSMAKMKKVMPQVKRLQERYSDNRQKLSQEMMALYKKEGANPLGGCLPLLVQMPVFLALYWVLIESVELRQAPFVLWIKDLAAMDPFFVLPLLYGASFYAMQLLNPPPPDPMQAKVMKAMPFVFTALFVFFPAGLVLYWLVNNLLSLLQQWYITRKIERASA
ncbi:MAG: membrane protein insertase YidC [Gammaproteobacteria bacterium]|nr:membrane protein insertase YidC [Gammaproteobacteria bacterium]